MSKNQKKSFLLLPAIVAFSSAAFADTCTFTNTTSTAAKLWTDANNWLNGKIPSAAGTNDVVFQNSSSTYSVNLNQNDTYVRSLYFTKGNGTSGVTASFSYSGYYTIHIGEGGLTVESGGKNVAPTIGNGVDIASSQTWRLAGDNDLSLSNTLRPSTNNVVWTVVGPRMLKFVSGGGGSFLGSIRANASFYIYDGRTGVMGTNGFTWFNYDGAEAVNTSGISFQNVFQATTAHDQTFPTPVTFDLTNTSVRATFQRTYNINYSDRGVLTMSGGFAGKIACPLTFQTTGAYTLYPDLLRTRITGNGAGLELNAGGTIAVSSDVLELANDDAFGTANAFPVLLGGDTASYHGMLCGLLASNTTVSGDITLVNGSKYSGALLGTLSAAGEVSYTGNVSNPTNSAGVSYNYVVLTAPAGGKATFSGKLSGGVSYPYEIAGGGEIVLEGDNSELGSGLLVRNGRLVLANADAAGSSVISLGAAVPAVTQADYVYENGAGTASANSLKTVSSVITYQGGGKTIDGAVPVEGDRILINNGQYSSFGIYTMQAAGALVKDTTVLTNAGTRVCVNKGAYFGGKTLYQTPWTICNMEGVGLPDVGVFTKGAVSIPCGISVVNNLSSGVHEIGGLTADASAFSGPVTLATNVIISAVAGGQVTLSGGISGTGEIIKSGAGTVTLTGANTVTGGFRLLEGTLSLPAAAVGRPLAWRIGATHGVLAVTGDLSLVGTPVTIETDGALDRKTFYTLAICTGTLSGKPDVTGIAEGWQVGIVGNALGLFYRRPGTVLSLK